MALPLAGGWTLDQNRSPALADIIGASRMDGGDDFFGVDPLQLDRGRAEGRVPELALDHVEHHVLACELNGVSVAQLHGVAVCSLRVGAR